MRFDDALTIVLGEEGGYTLSTLAGDSGGQTFAGIARTKWPAWAGWTLIDVGDTASAQLKNMVWAFYLQTFWNPLRCDELSPRTAILLFDFAINAGTEHAIECLQSACNEILAHVKDKPLAVDGVIGPITIAQSQVLEASGELQLFYAEMLAYYEKTKGWLTFHDGWINRVIDEMRAIQ